MIAFEVKDMTCGHCVSTITQDLLLREVLEAVTPVDVLAGARPATAGLAPVRKGCCCG